MCTLLGAQEDSQNSFALFSYWLFLPSVLSLLLSLLLPLESSLWAIIGLYFLVHGASACFYSTSTLLFSLSCRSRQSLGCACTSYALTNFSFDSIPSLPMNFPQLRSPNFVHLSSWLRQQRLCCCCPLLALCVYMYWNMTVLLMLRIWRLELGEACGCIHLAQQQICIACNIRNVLQSAEIHYGPPLPVL